MFVMVREMCLYEKLMMNHLPFNFRMCFQFTKSHLGCQVFNQVFFKMSEAEQVTLSR